MRMTTQMRDAVASDNSQAAARRQPGGGASGPDTCCQRFVWRETTPTDHVCDAANARLSGRQQYRRSKPSRIKLIAIN